MSFRKKLTITDRFQNSLTYIVVSNEAMIDQREVVSSTPNVLVLNGMRSSSTDDVPNDVCPPEKSTTTVILAARVMTKKMEAELKKEACMTIIPWSVDLNVNHMGPYLAEVVGGAFK